MRQSADLDPAIDRFQQRLSAAYAQHPPLADVPPAERRRIAEEVRAALRVGGPSMRLTEELRVGDVGVRIRILKPHASRLMPALIYLHGGGWTMFSLDTHDRLMREYASRAGVAVIGIDYSLAPEARFPLALEEILSVIAWLRSEGLNHGIDPDRIAIGGDSAGANLALGASLSLREKGEPPLAAMLLNYGAFAAETAEFASYAQFDGDGYNLTAEEMAGFWSGYVRGPGDLADPLVSPILADPTGLPPSFFTIAACDILADENRALAKRMVQAGVAVEIREYEGTVHGFIEAIANAPLAEQAVANGACWLRSKFKSPEVLMIGAGRMGRALVRGWEDIADLFYLDPAVDYVPGANKLASAEEIAKLPVPLLVVLAVKPQMLAEILPKLSWVAGSGVTFLSIGAGIELSTLRTALGDEARILRAMPNSPVSVFKGTIAVMADFDLGVPVHGMIERLLGAFGTVVWLESEQQMNAATAVSGSGPAYFFRFAEALENAGINAGLDSVTATRLARATLSGSGILADVTDTPLADLRAAVTSPGGTTAAAVAALEEGGIDQIVENAVGAATRRAKDLAQK